MRRSHFICLILGLVLLFGGPAVGLFTTVVGMQRAFAQAAASGQADAAKLSQGVRQALVGTRIGLAVGVAGLGIVIFAVCLHAAARRARRAGPPEGAAPDARQDAPSTS